MGAHGRVYDTIFHAGLGAIIIIPPDSYYFGYLSVAFHILLILLILSQSQWRAMGGWSKVDHGTSFNALIRFGRAQ